MEQRICGCGEPIYWSQVYETLRHRDQRLDLHHKAEEQLELFTPKQG